MAMNKSQKIAESKGLCCPYTLYGLAIKNGKTTSQTAQELGVSKSLVRRWKRRIFKGKATPCLSCPPDLDLYLALQIPREYADEQEESS